LQFDPYTYRYARTFLPAGMRGYDPAPAIRRLADRSSLVPQVRDRLYGRSPQRRVAVNGAELFWRAEGEGDTIVLVSPLGADSSFWARQLDALAGAYRVVTYDPRGSGASTPCPPSCSVEMLADDLAALLDTLGVRTAHLVGLALGALTAAEVAAQRPDLVRSLVLASCYPAADDRLREVTGRWREAAGSRGMEALFEECLPWLFTPGYIRDSRAELDRLRLFFRLTMQDPESFRRQSLAGVRHDARPALKAVTCPTLVLHGSADRLVRRRCAEETAGCLADPRLTVLTDAPHFMTWENADRFNRLLTEFLAERTRRELTVRPAERRRTR
jgi:pimeloyl-ACP methyl ester carboxylesterase